MEEKMKVKKGAVIGLKIEYPWIIHFFFNIILKLNQLDQYKPLN